MPEEMTESVAVSEPEGLDVFLDAYIEAALWASIDDDGGSLDRNHGVDDIAPETLAQMRADCLAFLINGLGGRLIMIAERLEAEGRWSLPAGANCSVMAYAGHDLWLTRNGHGCGYLDGDWPRGLGYGLVKLAHDFGAFDLYAGDDGFIYGC